MAVQLEIRVYTKTYENQVGEDAKTWCDGVFERFGPDGTLMRGF